MTNAERLVLLRRGRHEIECVREDVNVASATCPHCKQVFRLDADGRRLDEELEVIYARLTSWIEVLEKRRPSSERVSQET